jgi:FlaA1/EpsC-like NDP-sugar epimerase
MLCVPHGIVSLKISIFFLPCYPCVFVGAFCTDSQKCNASLLHGSHSTVPRRFYEIFLSLRNRHLMVIDLACVCVVPVIALVLRQKSLENLAEFGLVIILYTVLSLVWKFSIFYPIGLYKRYWRLANVEDFGILAGAATVSWVTGIFLTLVVFKPLGLLPGLPQAVPIIDGVLTMLIIGGIRFSVRTMDYLSKAGSGKNRTRNVLIAGAGSAGSMVLKELRVNPRLGLKPVGFVDDDMNKKGIRLNGVPVLGTLKDLPGLIRSENVDEVIVAMPKVPGRVVRDVVRICSDARIKSSTIPGLYEILDGTATVQQFRDIRIDDLLKRGPITIDNQKIRTSLSGARVLVTGAGGSIGSELCRQIAKFGPSDLVLVGQGENSIFEIAAELKKVYERDQTIHIHSVVANIRDQERMDFVFQIHRPQVIFHAAAHKHIGLMEVNVADAITNNVKGTRILVDLAANHGVERFVMISSQKAAKPNSVMGVTKRVAELVVLDAARRTEKAFVTVRFGNVLGSRGSVISIFKDQIAAGGPVIVTHPDATRYFMTIPESVHLVLQAATMGRGGEVFVLDMGEPVRILDLARDLIRLSGREEGRDIEIEYSGLRKGEKLHEELFDEGEVPLRSEHKKILVCRNDNIPLGGKELGEKIELLIAAAQDGALGKVEEYLKKIVPEYTPSDAVPPARPPDESEIPAGMGTKPGRRRL